MNLIKWLVKYMKSQSPLKFKVMTSCNTHKISIFLCAHKGCYLRIIFYKLPTELFRKIKHLGNVYFYQDSLALHLALHKMGQTWKISGSDAQHLINKNSDKRFQS